MTFSKRFAAKPLLSTKLKELFQIQVDFIEIQRSSVGLKNTLELSKVIDNNSLAAKCLDFMLAIFLVLAVTLTTGP